jgi:hypothetical protein
MSDAFGVADDVAGAHGVAVGCCWDELQLRIDGLCVSAWAAFLEVEKRRPGCEWNEVACERQGPRTSPWSVCISGLRSVLVGWERRLLSTRGTYRVELERFAQGRRILLIPMTRAPNAANATAMTTT